MTALPVNPFLSPKSGEHDVTVTSFAGDLSEVGSQFFDTMCKIDAGEGLQNLVAIRPLFSEISRKNERGGSKKPPPKWGAG